MRQNSTILPNISALTFAVVEHNIQILSKVYLNITFESLALHIQGLSAEEVELIVCKIIADGRL